MKYFPGTIKQLACRKMSGENFENRLTNKLKVIGQNILNRNFLYINFIEER